MGSPTGVSRRRDQQHYNQPGVEYCCHWLAQDGQEGVPAHLHADGEWHIGQNLSLTKRGLVWPLVCVRARARVYMFTCVFMFEWTNGRMDERDGKSIDISVWVYDHVNK
jgi:hypothetical protein